MQAVNSSDPTNVDAHRLRPVPTTIPAPHQQRRTPEHEPNDVAGCGAKRRADADLSASPGDGVRGDAVETDRRKQERQPAKHPRQRCDQAILSERLVHLCGERAECECEIAVDTGQCCGDAARQQRRGTN